MLRVPMVLVALIATPFVASVAQERTQRPAPARDDRRGDDKCKDKKNQPAAPQHAAAGSSAREALQRAADRRAAGCPSDPPAPPPVVTPPPVVQPPVDTQPTPVPPPVDTLPTPPDTEPTPPAPPAPVGELWGTAFVDYAGNGYWDWPDAGAPGWIIEISGPVNASLTTDAFGNYAFKELPGGTYTICQVPESGGAGWTQKVPFSGTACLGGGFGYTRTLPVGQAIRFIGNDFGNMPPADPSEPPPQ
jgi:hypothetical protein